MDSTLVLSIRWIPAGRSDDSAGTSGKWKNSVLADVEPHYPYRFSPTGAKKMRLRRSRGDASY